MIATLHPRLMLPTFMNVDTGWNNILSLAGVGVPGLYQGLVPGQGLSLSLSHSNTIFPEFHVEMCKQVLSKV